MEPPAVTLLHPLQNASKPFCGCAACAPLQPRRRFLKESIAAMALAAGGMSLLSCRPAAAQTTLRPDEALKELMDGNARFVAGELTSFDDDLHILKSNTIDKQEPFAAVLSCADSRAPVELLFDQSIGHVFVARVAGNICTPEIIASLEYGAGVLGTKAIVVLGHSDCGAVKATAAGKAVPGQISALYAPIRPAVDRAGSDLEAAIKANAQIQAGLLRTASPLIAGLIKDNNVKVVAAYYNLADGKVSLLP
ncbi:Carbonic anhydrase [Methylocella tundrae]|jgi:carbonic anhydrase|nr:Carbonic anhydrase [Methylocella tundrae]